MRVFTKKSGMKKHGNIIEHSVMQFTFFKTELGAELTFTADDGQDYIVNIDPGNLELFQNSMQKFIGDSLKSVSYVTKIPKAEVN